MHALVGIVLTLHASTATGQGNPETTPTPPGGREVLLSVPKFFRAHGAGPLGDQAWLDSLPGSPLEFDFEEFSVGDLVDQFSVGGLTIDVDLEGAEGADESLLVFNISGGDRTVLDDRVLLNQGRGPIRLRIVLRFSRPVSGFGCWVFDDDHSLNKAFRIGMTPANESRPCESPPARS